MKNNQSTTYTLYQILSEKELQQISGGDKRRKNNVAELINLIFGRGGN